MRKHVGDVAEVDHQIVVAERIAAFGEPHVGRTGVASLFIGVAHVFAREELRLLDVDRAPRLRCGDQKVGLAAEEGRNLNHVDHLAYGRRLP